MEVYAIYRDVISYGLMSNVSEKSSRVYKMAYNLEEINKKIIYIEEALDFFMRGLERN